MRQYTHTHVQQVCVELAAVLGQEAGDAFVELAALLGLVGAGEDHDIVNVCPSDPQVREVVKGEAIARGVGRRSVLYCSSHGGHVGKDLAIVQTLHWPPATVVKRNHLEKGEGVEVRT